MEIFLCPTEFNVIGDYAAEMLLSLENAANYTAVVSIFLSMISVTLNCLKCNLLMYLL